MRRSIKRVLAGLFAAGLAWSSFALPVQVAPTQAASTITAAEIIERNAAARGGVDAWKKLQTLAWSGHVESDAMPGHKLPFLLEQMRPNKTRFELMTDGQRSVRVYDGGTGWKLRPNGGSGRPELAPYTDDELKFARGAQVIDGPLMDYVAKGAVITFGGFAEAEGRRAYIVEAKLPSGGNHRVWVDAETFLEIRHDRQVRGAAGQMGTVMVLFRDYREFEGLQIPTTIETGGAVGVAPNKLVIERVSLNPKFDDRMFAKPETPVSRRNSIIVDTRGSSAANAHPPGAQP